MSVNLVTEGLFVQLLIALPRLSVVCLTHMRMPMAVLHNFAAACVAQARKIELQMSQDVVSEEQAAALASDWVTVMRVLLWEGLL